MVQTRLDMFNPTEASSSSTYSEDVDSEELAKMVAVMGLSFSFPSHLGFIHYIQPVYNFSFKGFSWNTIKNDIFKFQVEHCHFLRCLFDKFDGRISVTFDMGRSVFGNDYFTVTAHWINHDWNMQKRIIAYKYVDESKTGMYIASTIAESMKYFRFIGKPMACTLDNASNNLKAIDDLKTRLCPMDEDHFHVRCSAHILNLIIHEGVHLFGDGCLKVRIACSSIFKNKKKGCNGWF